MKNDPKIYVVIANYNSGKWLEKCYGSIFESDIEVKVVVVDNHSEDRSPDIIKESFPQIELIRSDVNLGFAKANNIGIRKALKEGANYVFLLNQDAWIESHTIRRLTEVSAQNPSYGILSPIHLNGSGELLDWNFSKYISQPFDDGRQLYTDLLLDRPLKTIYDVKYVNAAAWLISRKCIEQAGLFEDNLILQNGEDTNYLARVFYHKLKVGILPDVFIYHDREDRKGSVTKSDLSHQYLVQRFVLNGLNINDKSGVHKMEERLKSEYKILGKQILKFKLSEARERYSYIKKMKDLMPEIIAKRKKYQQPWGQAERTKSKQITT